jgi:hypothetical protein
MLMESGMELTSMDHDESSIWARASTRQGVANKQRLRRGFSCRRFLMPCPPRPRRDRPDDGSRNRMQPMISTSGAGLTNKK